MTLLSRFEGCLLGGAVGDALGYEVEFESDSDIRSRFGPGGIQSMVLHGGLARISDDTQMTLYTANGILLSPNDPTAAIWDCYADWEKTQRSKGIPGKRAFLNDIPSLHSPRAPGNTCLAALRGGVPGTLEAPVNHSKGCGGVMRVAPIGLYYRENADLLGARAAALTHGHPLGYLPGAMLAHIVSAITHRDMSVLAAVRSARETVERVFGPGPDVTRMQKLMDLAMELAATGAPDAEALRWLGEGWVGDEALAVAVYCALKYSDDFRSAMIAAVNHSGDSDSTGAICGNILGASLGVEAIPADYLEHLEHRSLLEEMARDLCLGPQDEADWNRKYNR